MAFSYKQVQVEFRSFVFAVVVNTTVLDTSSTTHFYGFADEVSCLLHKKQTKTNRRIFFQKNQRKTSGLYVGPCFLTESPTVRRATPPKDTLLVGHVKSTTKGLMFTWWMVDEGGALFHFVQYIYRGFVGKTNSALLFRQLKLPNDDHADDLWLLFLLLSGHVDVAVKEMVGTARLRHPARKTIGLTLSRTMPDFVFLSALFSRQRELFVQFEQVCARRGVDVSHFNKDYYDNKELLGGCL
jgi:hypothetical protein